MRNEYSRGDFGKSVRGKHYDRYRESSSIVVLDPGVAKVFPNAQAVNDALRQLVSERTWTSR